MHAGPFAGFWPIGLISVLLIAYVVVMHVGGEEARSVPLFAIYPETRIYLSDMEDFHLV